MIVAICDIEFGFEECDYLNMGVGLSESLPEGAEGVGEFGTRSFSTADLGVCFYRDNMGPNSLGMGFSQDFR